MSLFSASAYVEPYVVSDKSAQFTIPANSAVTKTVTFSESVDTSKSIILAYCGNTNIMVNAYLYDSSTGYVTARNFSSSSVTTGVKTVVLSNKATTISVS